MKIKILFLVFYIIPLLAFTQTLDWAKRIGGLKTEAAYGIVIDKAGNIYTTGFFGGTVDFDPGAGVSNLSALSDENIFIQKLDANGDFVWAKSMLGTLESRAYIMALDSAGDVYVTGYFKGTVDFDPNAGTTNITSNGENDLFVLKLSSTGNLVWVKAMGGTDVEIALGISVDAMGNVFTSGGFSDTVDFDPGVGVSNLISKGSTDIFIQKLNSAGDLVWAKSVGGVGGDYSLSIDVDASGNSYITGYFRDTVDFDPNAAIANYVAKGIGDIYVLKLDANGNFVWLSNSGGDGYDRGFAIVVDNAGDIYSTGHFQDTVDFDPGTGITQVISNGKSDIYIQKHDAAGNLLWAKGVGGKSNEYGIAMAVDKNNNVYTTGYYSDTADFNPGSDTTILIPNIGFGDIYVQKLDATGNFVWAVSMGGVDFERGLAINIGNLGDIYTSGHFSGKADFDPSADSTFLISAGIWDIYIQKMNPENTIGITDFRTNKLLLYPNPNAGKFVIELPTKANNAQLYVFSLAGEEVHQRKLNSTKNNIDISDLPTGVYLINITLSSGEKYYGRVVLGK